ncbi:MAG TPA: hypothetical protein DD706_11495 [Nitrospiraceae bacterium]|nr:hypothetical protein [Nitrospiraceae bacterium]
MLVPRIGTMNIAIDESGTFVYTDTDNSWNCVVSYVYPEVHNPHIQEEVRKLVQRHAKGGQKEVKLRNLSESAYANFLRCLQKWDGVLYAVATNAAANTPQVLECHQEEQTQKILEHLDKMIYETGREGVRRLAKRVKALPHQLYVQMICQVQLVIQILHSALLFYVQRHPPTLNRFRWRIDQKNSSQTSYEDAYSQVLPAILQSASICKPIPMLKGEDYHWFDRFYFPKGEVPTYLRDVYGVEIVDDNERKINIGQVVHEDVRFVDSKSDSGVQIADLLASGLRRCLRGQFTDNNIIASLIGGLMVQREHNQIPIQLISLGKEEKKVEGQVLSALHAMAIQSRAMIVRQ